MAQEPFPQQFNKVFSDAPTATSFDEEKQKLINLYHNTYELTLDIHRFHISPPLAFNSDPKLFEKVSNDPGYLHKHCFSNGPEQLGKYCIPYPIEVAAFQNSKQLVSYFIKKGHLIDSSQPLFSAISAENTEIMKILIQAGASVTRCELNRNIWRYHIGEISLTQFEPILCPLAYAIKTNSSKAAKRLLKSGANLNDVNYLNPFNPSLMKDQQCTVRALIKSGALIPFEDKKKLINLYHNTYELTLDIHRSHISSPLAFNSDPKLFEKVSNDPGYLHKHCFSNGPEQLGKYCIPYPIEVAAFQNSKQLVSYFIEKGHLIDSSQPLFSAISAGNTKVMKILIQAGASVTRCEFNRDIWGYHMGKTTLGEFEPILCPLAYTIKTNRVNAAKRLLKSGASLNDVNYLNPFNPNLMKNQQCTVNDLIKSGVLIPSNGINEVLSAFSATQTKTLQPF